MLHYKGFAFLIEMGSLFSQIVKYTVDCFSCVQHTFPQPSIMRYWYWLAVCVSTWKAGWWFVGFCSQITKIKLLYIHTRLNKWILGLFNFCRARPMEWGHACAEWWLIANNFQKYVCNSLVWPCWYSPMIIPVAYSLAGLGSNFLLGLENSSPHTPHLPWFTSLCCTWHYKEVEFDTLRKLWFPTPMSME